MKPITLMDVLTSSGSHPDREHSPECDGYVHVNAYDVAKRVSALLLHLGISSAKVNSGFRTKAANLAAKGSVNSAHLSGMAVDLDDPKAAICNAIMADPSVLETFDLYMESPQHTPGWTHLSTRVSKSGNRIFIP